MRALTLGACSSPSLILLSLLSSFADATNPGCDRIQVNKKNFGLSPLGGIHSLWVIEKNQPHNYNTTYTFNICQPLKRSSSKPKDEQCPNGTWVCGVKRLVSTAFSRRREDSNAQDSDPKSKDEVVSVVPIAGDFSHNFGGDMDAKWTLLSESSSHADSEKEGLRLEMGGGRSPFERNGRKQMAVFEFLCDEKRDGLEDEKKKEEDKSRRSRRDDDDEDDDPDEKIDPSDGRAKDRSLKFISHDTSGDVDKLRLEWRTKYACEDYLDNAKGSSSHWGFFTWIIIITFLGVAAYLIFGSWLNYNRYGARGWDLLPHGDTIRDVPYLMKDFVKRVANTVQGGGSRGGYSAV